MPEVLLEWAEIIVFSVFAIFTAYIFIFALASLFYRTPSIQKSHSHSKFLILIPSYKDDSVILAAAESVINQDYPKEMMEVVIISDRMSNETNTRLLDMGLKVIVFEPETSSKAKALDHAIFLYKDEIFDNVIIMDSDNIASFDMLKILNDAFSMGYKAIQAHRTAKNMDTDVALLDAISEEINNSIFRKGHVALGLSSALIGSGMAFEFEWFKKVVSSLINAGEDKELEIMLLKEGITIHYLDNLLVLDEKTKYETTYYNQRRRWIAAQFHSLSTSLKGLPTAILTLNISYIDKVLQWTMPPRVVLLGIVFCISIISTIFEASVSLKWWLLLLFIIIALLISIPAKMIRNLSFSTFMILPKIFILTVMNFFRMGGAVKKFIHTPKN